MTPGIRGGQDYLGEVLGCQFYFLQQSSDSLLHPPHVSIGYCPPVLRPLHKDILISSPDIGYFINYGVKPLDTGSDVIIADKASCCTITNKLLAHRLWNSHPTI